MKNLLIKIDKAQAKINENRPFTRELNQQLKEYFRIGFTFASNALEGNSLTISETKVILEDGLTIAGKPLKDYYEATGHSEAFDYMYDLIEGKKITEEYIKKLHSFFYQRIKKDEAGVYRKQPAIITGSQYPLPKPNDISNLMKNFENKISLFKKEHPIIYAAIIHKELVFIHPFVDGNGRVARLLMNLALLQTGYTIAIIPPFKRAEYIMTLEKAHLNDKDFIKLIASCLYETQKDLLRILNGEVNIGE